MRNLRTNLVFVLFSLFSAVLISRLFYIQVIKNDYYKALAQGLQIFPNEIQKERGEIFLNDYSQPLAINWNFPLVFASPPKITEPEKTAKALSQILNLSEDFILQTFQKDTLYSPIKNKLTPEEVDQIEKINLSGIYLSEIRGRYYPQETLASQVVGFLDVNYQGQYGLEEYYNQILNGDSKGSDLILTIDYNIQFKAEKLLEEAKENLNIENGQIIVMDPNSGKILTTANFPNFNPNQYEKYASEGDLGIFKNGALQELFEPGSVFKPITMAVALNEEKITPKTTYYDPGEIKIDGWKIYNYDGRKYPGEITMTEVLEKSINTGAVFAVQQISGNIFLDYIEKFGFFKKTGIDLQEIYSENREVKKGKPINFATASFGQGVSVTPIQLAKAFSAIANGGKLVRPYLVEKILTDGNTIETKPEISEPILSQKTVSQLTAMMVSVIENGFGKRAKVPGYYIAGKTGTAQVAEGGVYLPNRTIQSFVGFAPAFSPRFLILVKLDNPQTKTAEYSAVPIFHDLAEYIINYWQIPPDYENI